MPCACIVLVLAKVSMLVLYMHGRGHAHHHHASISPRAFLLGYSRTDHEDRPVSPTRHQASAYCLLHRHPGKSSDKNAMAMTLLVDAMAPAMLNRKWHATCGCTLPYLECALSVVVMHAAMQTLNNDLVSSLNCQ